ncbi:AraC family transcriptional regulator [Labrys miyagiensis]
MSDDTPRDGEGSAGKRANTPTQERRRWPRQQKSNDDSKPRSPSALKPLAFSTLDLTPGEQFDAWRSYVAPLMDVQLPDGVSEEQGFAISHVAWNFRNMLLVQQRGDAYRYQRSEAKLRSSLLDHWSITLRRTGRSWTEVGGRVAESLPGTIEIRSLGRPFRGRLLESEFLTIYMPRTLFGDSVWLLDANNNAVLSSNLADVLAKYINAIEARLAEFTEEELPGVISATRDMIIACLSASETSPKGENRIGAVSLIERARKYIRENLSSTQITPDVLCRELGLSRTHLYQLFEPSGGVVRYIQRQRLLAAHAALSDPQDRRQVSTIAHTFGFNSSADFSRAFSREFGYSPTEARNLIAPTHGALHHDKAKIVETSSFESWLRALGS